MLYVNFRYSSDCTPETPVITKEVRGGVVYELYRGFFRPEGVVALNASTEQLLDGGQWFQLWKGEIVSMCSPVENGGQRAGVHRGPLVH